MIYTTELVARSAAYPAKFFQKDLNDAIECWQNQGLEVEVQFQGDSDSWSALLIVRRANEVS